MAPQGPTVWQDLALVMGTWPSLCPSLCPGAAAGQPVLLRTDQCAACVCGGLATSDRFRMATFSPSTGTGDLPVGPLPGHSVHEGWLWSVGAGLCLTAVTA